MTAQKDGERLAKVIARSGLSSRRGAERLVEDGRVQVNDQTVHHPGHPVTDDDEIRVDGQPLPSQPDRVYYLLYKPRGTITGRDDPEGRRSVLELVEHLAVRVEPVGRLDMDTEGALLMTNDGQLAHRLTHPSTQVPKRYLVKVWKTPDDRKMRLIQEGVHLEDGKTAPCKARIVETTDSGNTWIEVTVTEGRNRLVRRMFEAIGHPVSKLRRESFATVSIRGMNRTDVRPLTPEELHRIRDLAAGVPAADAGKTFKYRRGFARPKPKPNRPLSKKKRQNQRKRAGSRGDKSGGGRR